MDYHADTSGSLYLEIETFMISFCVELTFSPAPPITICKTLTVCFKGRVLPVYLHSWLTHLEAAGNQLISVQLVALQLKKSLTSGKRSITWNINGDMEQTWGDRLRKQGWNTRRGTKEQVSETHTQRGSETHREITNRKEKIRQRGNKQRHDWGNINSENTTNSHRKHKVDTKVQKEPDWSRNTNKLKDIDSKNQTQD